MRNPRGDRDAADTWDGASDKSASLAQGVPGSGGKPSAVIEVRTNC